MREAFPGEIRDGPHPHRPVLIARRDDRVATQCSVRCLGVEVAANRETPGQWQRPCVAD